MPISTEKSRVATMAAQTSQPYCVVKMAINIPVAPTVEPTDRSNSPPIISSATGTARIAYSAETLNQLDVANKLTKLLLPATMAKKIHTAIEPATAPVSGRTRSRRSGLARSVRSLVITLIFPSIGNIGAGLVVTRLETGDHKVHDFVSRSPRNGRPQGFAP